MSAWCCRCCALRRARQKYQNNYDIEEGEICRICFEGGEGLIAPCLCAGSSKWVHRRCLDNWRATRHNPQCFTHCNTCNYQYRVWLKQQRVSKRLKLCLLLTRDILTLLIIAELLIVLMSAICYGLDIPAGRNIWNLFPHQSWPDGAQVGVYYLAGIVFFFAILGLIGLLVSCYCLCCKTPRRCNDTDAAFLDIYCCWFGYPCHLGYYFPVAPVFEGCGNCGGCSCTEVNCNFCDGGDGDGNAIIIIVIIVLAIIVLLSLVFIGIIFAIIIIVWFILVVGRRHFNILYKRELAKEEVVCDLSMYDYEVIEKLPNYLEYEGVPLEACVED